MRVLGAIAAAALLTLATAGARADEPPRRDSRSGDDAPATPKPRKTWYGYQFLAVDAPLDILYFVGANTSWSDSGLLTAVGVVVPIFVGAVGHAGHDRPAGAIVMSLTLRILLPIVAGFAGRAATTQPACTPSPDAAPGFDGCPLSFAGFANGYGVGMLLAQAIDDGLIAWDPAPNAPATAPQSFTWSPRLGGARMENGHTVTTFGIRGTF
jgi:hypothetical protein